MDKEFIDYKTALALKELGFDEPCFATYSNVKEEEIEKGSLSYYQGQFLPISDNMFCLAPLKQQVFRWFRNEYNIQSSIEWNKSDHVWFTFKIYFERLATGENPPVMVGHYVNSWLGLNLEFSTYEEAEEACLDKLIEICKNK